MLVYRYENYGNIIYIFFSVDAWLRKMLTRAYKSEKKKASELCGEMINWSPMTLIDIYF